MEGAELLRIVDAIHREKEIDPETLFEGIESALLTAARKQYGTEGEINVEILENIRGRETFAVSKHGAADTVYKCAETPGPAIHFNPKRARAGRHQSQSESACLFQMPGEQVDIEIYFRAEHGIQALQYKLPAVFNRDQKGLVD